MNWLRSEDLKDEKVVTTPSPLYHVEGALLDPNYVDGRTREIMGYMASRPKRHSQKSPRRWRSRGWLRLHERKVTFFGMQF